MPAMSSSNFDFSRMENGVNSVLGLNPLGSLLADDDDDAIPGQSLNGLTDNFRHLHMETNGDGFPLLRRRDTDADQSADDRQTNGLPAVHRHRAGQQSLPWNTLRHSQHEDMDESVFASPGRKSNVNNRRSMEVYSSAIGTQSKRSSMHSVTNGYTSNIPKLQQSYSTSDIPTVKNVNLHEPNATSGANMTHAEQHLQNHRASIGRIPFSASNRQSRDFSALDPRADETAIMPLPSALQANAPSFSSPPPTMSSPGAPTSLAQTIPTAYTASNGFYNSYNMPIMNMGVNGVGFGGHQNGWTNGAYGQQYQYNGYSGGAAYSRPQFQVPDSQRAVMKNRKGEDGMFRCLFLSAHAKNFTESARFAQYDLETLTGQIYDLCKDQHGCRYLQRKIEEGNETHIAMIFNETKDHIVELMTGKCLQALWLT
jgi:hypothetical protein